MLAVRSTRTSDQGLRSLAVIGDCNVAKVSEPQMLSQSASSSGLAGIISTESSSHMPPMGNVSSASPRSSVRAEIGLRCSGLEAWNLLLRHQIAVLKRSAKRPKSAGRNRLLWVLVSLIWRKWKECVIIVQPATLVGWHRAGFCAYLRWKCRGGRPAIRRNLRELIQRIAAENPLWGVPRIQAELAMLGHRFARATIAKCLGVRPRRSPTWQTFIRNHMETTAAMDFFTVPTITGRVLNVFVLLHYARRRFVHFNVTAAPSSAWVVRQLKDAFPFDLAPRS